MPTAVPPNVQGWLTKMGDCCVRASGVAPLSQLSLAEGLQVKPLPYLITSGTSRVLMAVDDVVPAILGFVPTIV